MKKQIRILAIDDEQVILDSIVKLCSAENWHVNPQLNARSALKSLSDKDYNLIVSDIMMPDMDGFEFLEELRKNEIHTPLIITTGFSTVENAVKSLYNGAIDFLPKPFTFDELISSIKRGLEYSRIMSHLAAHTLTPSSDDTAIVYIPCPPKYRRLGYTTWSYLEDDGSVKVGLTDLFLRTVENIDQIELFNVDDEIIQGNTCCRVMTADQLAHNILAPMGGHILKRNEKVLQDHTIVEKDPYFEGWLYVIIPTNLDYESKHLVPCSSDRM